MNEDELRVVLDHEPNRRLHRLLRSRGEVDWTQDLSEGHAFPCCNLLASAEAEQRPGPRDVLAEQLPVELNPRPHAVNATGQATDTGLAESFRAMLKWHVLIPEHRIHTTVSHGVVTLSGTVDFPSQRDDAARAVGYRNSVCGASNELTVVAPAILPEALRSAIEGALERHASREAKKAQLDVDGGKDTRPGTSTRSPSGWP